MMIRVFLLIFLLYSCFGREEGMMRNHFLQQVSDGQNLGEYDAKQIVRHLQMIREYGILYGQF